MTTLLAAAVLALSGALAGRSFSGIVKAYRLRAGVPWLASLIFAAAAAAAVLALHALLPG
ncbi:MAG: hypothetical protein ABFD52_03435 [Acidobacteriota bacterium]